MASGATGVTGDNVWAVCKARRNNPVGLVGLRVKHPPSGTDFECEGYWWGEGGPEAGALWLYGFGHLDWNDETSWPMINEKPRKGYPAMECILVSPWPVPRPKYRLVKGGRPGGRKPSQDDEDLRWGFL